MDRSERQHVPLAQLERAGLLQRSGRQFEFGRGRYEAGIGRRANDVRPLDHNHRDCPPEAMIVDTNIAISVGAFYTRFRGNPHHGLPP